MPVDHISVFPPVRQFPNIEGHTTSILSRPDLARATRLLLHQLEAHSSRYPRPVFTPRANFKFGFSALLGFVEAGPGT